MTDLTLSRRQFDIQNEASGKIVFFLLPRMYGKNSDWDFRLKQAA